MYAETRNMTFYGNDSFGGIANKTQNFEVVAQYQFDDFNLPLRPSVAYLQSKGKDLRLFSLRRQGSGQVCRRGHDLLLNKICPPMWIIKSTCWMKTTASTKQRYRDR